MERSSLRSIRICHSSVTCVASLVLCGISSLLFPALGRAAVFTVGPLAEGCKFESLNDAIAAMRLQTDSEKVLRLSTGAEFTGHRLIIDYSLEIHGGYPSCTADEPGDFRSTIGGTPDGSVIDITEGADPLERVRVVLRGLEIRDGGSSFEHQGGGVRITGFSEVLLQNVLVIDNQAGLGGGIFIDGSRGARLDIEDTSILRNAIVIDPFESAAGAGIYCRNDASIATRGRVQIARNDARPGTGGGVFLDEGCRMDAGGNFEVNVNFARHGGGVVVDDGSTMVLRGSSSERVRVFSNRVDDPDPSINPTAAGVWVRRPGSRFIAHRAQILDNRIVEPNSSARFGGGLLVEDGGFARLDSRSSGGDCGDGTRCSVLSSNVAGSAAALRVKDPGSRVEIVGTYIEENDDVSALLEVLEGAELLVEGSVIAENRTRNLLFMNKPSTATFAFITATANDPALLDSLFVLSGGDARFELFSSIAHEPGLPVLENLGGIADVDCLFAENNQGLSGLGIIAKNLAFFPESGLRSSDYHLLESSLAVDFCDTRRYTPTAFDIDGGPRGFDDERDDFLGPFDLGADELDSDARVFSDGFESGDTASWSGSLGR